MDQIASDLEWLRSHAVAREQAATTAAADATTTFGLSTPQSDLSENGGAAADERENSRHTAGRADGTAHGIIKGTTVFLTSLAEMEPLPEKTQMVSAATAAAPPSECTTAAPMDDAALSLMFAELSRDTVVGTLQEDNMTSRQAEKQTQESLQRVLRQLAEAQHEAEQHHAFADHLCCQVTLFSSDLQVVEAQTETLLSAVQTLREEVSKAWDENGRLHTKLAAAEVELGVLAQLKAAHAQACAELAALNAQRDDMEREHGEWKTLVAKGRAAVEEGVAYWQACRGEHEALQAALATSEATNRTWETLFVTRDVSATPCRAEDDEEVCHAQVNQTRARARTESSDDALHDTSLDVGAEEVMEEDMTSVGRVQSESSQLLGVLEAKVVHLALALQLSEQRASVYATQYHTLSAMRTLDMSLLTSCQAQLAVVRPVGAALATHCAALQAAALAAESSYEALLHKHEALLDAYTDDALHTHEMELALAQYITAPPPPVVGGGGVGLHRSVPISSLPVGRVRLGTRPEAAPSLAPPPLPRPTLADLFPKDRKRPHG